LSWLMCRTAKPATQSTLECIGLEWLNNWGPSKHSTTTNSIKSRSNKESTLHQSSSSSKTIITIDTYSV
jgi:hypothetical protein